MAAPRPRPPPPPPARDDAGLAFRVRAPTAEASARNQSFRLARRGWREATKFIKMKTPFLKYERVLGYGGFGVVLLYTVLDAYGGPQKQVAIKFARAATNTNRREAFRLELDWLLKFKGAEHMVQLVDLPEMVLDPKEYNNNFPSYQILVMEFMSRADLYSLVMRLTDARDDNETLKEEDRKLEYIPVRILWRIFLCLVRACVGMAYLPPGNVPDRPPVGREEIPERGNERAIIHFDLDIYNVFMGSALLDDEHDVNPIAKLADFGLTKEWDDNDTTTYKEAKLLSGKRSFRTPEQQDNDDTAREPGRVSSALNIFAVGMVMYCLLTVHLPYDYLEKSETWPLETPDGSRYIETCAPAIVKTPSFWDFIDRRLRHLIARCMAKDPKLRPSLKELVDSIKERIEEANKMEQTLIDAEEAEERETGKKPEPVVINTSQPPTHPAPERLALLRRFYAEYINNVAADTAPDPYKDFWSQPSSASAPTLYSLDSFAQNTTAAAAALRPPVRRPPPPPPPPPRRPPPPPPRRTPFRPRTPPILPPAMTEMLSLVEQVFDTRHIAARDIYLPVGTLVPVIEPLPGIVYPRGYQLPVRPLLAPQLLAAGEPLLMGTMIPEDASFPPGTWIKTAVGPAPAPPPGPLPPGVSGPPKTSAPPDPPKTSAPPGESAPPALPSSTRPPGTSGGGRSLSFDPGARGRGWGRGRGLGRGRGGTAPGTPRGGGPATAAGRAGGGRGVYSLRGARGTSRGGGGGTAPLGPPPRGGSGTTRGGGGSGSPPSLSPGAPRARAAVRGAVAVRGGRGTSRSLSSRGRGNRGGT